MTKRKLMLRMKILWLTSWLSLKRTLHPKVKQKVTSPKGEKEAEVLVEKQASQVRKISPEGDQRTVLGIRNQNLIQRDIEIDLETGGERGVERGTDQGKGVEVDQGRSIEEGQKIGREVGQEIEGKGAGQEVNETEVDRKNVSETGASKEDSRKIERVWNWMMIQYQGR